MGAGAPSSSIESIADPVLVVHDGAHPIDYYVAPGPNGSELVHTKYQSIGAWSRIASGSAVIPSSITQPGDLAFVNADKTSANGRRTVTISANSDQPQRFLSCLVPLRLWLSTDHGGHWTDSTALMTDLPQRWIYKANSKRSSKENLPTTSLCVGSLFTNKQSAGIQTSTTACGSTSGRS
jgi:hypothetical protein